jgi:hypothetical protein
VELNVGPNVIKPNHDEGFTLCKNHFFFKLKKIHDTQWILVGYPLGVMDPKKKKKRKKKLRFLH